MELQLHLIRDADEARALAPRLDRFAREISAEFRDDELPEGVVRGLVDRSFDAPESLWLLARASDDAEPVGVCVTAPLEDPLVGERIPLVVLLHVDRDYRHRGLARQLVEAARRELAERGIHKLAARAGHNDDALISMGERWGFTRHWELMLHE